MLSEYNIQFHLLLPGAFIPQPINLMLSTYLSLSLCSYLTPPPCTSVLFTNPWHLREWFLPLPLTKVKMKESLLSSVCIIWQVWFSSLSCIDARYTNHYANRANNDKMIRYIKVVCWIYGSFLTKIHRLVFFEKVMKCFL